MSNPGNMTYAETDYPRIGTVRQSSQKNELLLKPKLGSVKRHTRDIPPPNFRHGVLSTWGDTVGDVMCHRSHVSNLNSTRGKDIRAMNKHAPGMNVTKADEQRQYREEHPLKLKVKRRLASVPPLPSNVNPDHVYGRPVPKGDSMEEVITHSFADEWIKMNQQHEHDFQIPEPLSVPARTTKAVLARSDSCYQKYNPPPPKERFIMTKFKTVGHKIDNVQTTPLMRDDRPPVFSRNSSCCGGPGGGAAGTGGIMSLLLGRQAPSPPPGPPPRGVDTMADVPLIFRRDQFQNAAGGPRRSDPSENVALIPSKGPCKPCGPRRSDPE